MRIVRLIPASHEGLRSDEGSYNARFVNARLRMRQAEYRRSPPIFSRVFSRKTIIPATETAMHVAFSTFFHQFGWKFLSRWKHPRFSLCSCV
jgi:hypothetical protein